MTAYISQHVSNVRLPVGAVMAITSALILLVALLVPSGASFQLVEPRLGQQPQSVLGIQRDAPTSNISVALFAELEELSRLVDISYCVGAAGLGIQKPFECLSRCAEFGQFELVTTWNTGPLLSDSCGYLALSHASNAKRLIVAFRGTYSITNTIADLTTIPQEYVPYPGDEDGASPEQSLQEQKPPKCENCTIHSGFYASWQNTRTVILPNIEAALQDFPDYDLVLVGHSLGGAVAAIAALELLAKGFQPTVTTFGEPRIGNEALARYVDMRFNLTNQTGSGDENSKPTFRRVTHINDPVPQLPLEEWGYMPHAGEIFIAKAELAPSVEDIRYCEGASDPRCIEQSESRAPGDFWTLPTRFKLWELLHAHRDYFWRLGLCLPVISHEDTLEL